MTTILDLAHDLEAAGLERENAEKIAISISALQQSDVATKADLALLKTDLAVLETRLTTRGIIGLSATATILFAALHLWPTHP